MASQIPAPLLKAVMPATANLAHIVVSYTALAVVAILLAIEAQP